MIALFLLACAEPKDTSSDETGEPVATGPCAPWLPYDLAGATWSYVDDEGRLVYALTALGARDWKYGTAIAVQADVYAEGAVVQTGSDFYMCTEEGLAAVGSDFVAGGIRYVTFIDPPALWLPTVLSVGTAWSSDSEAVVETYDADGGAIERSGGFAAWEAVVTEASDAVVPAGTFPSLVVDFGPGATFTYARDVGMVSLSDGRGGASLSAYSTP